MTNMISRILEYLNSASFWTYEQIWYLMSRDGRESKNVSKFLAEQMTNPALIEIVKNHGWDTEPNKDWVMIQILKWVRSYLVYDYDFRTYNQSEYWATVDEIFNKTKGDCEDGSILIFCLARLSGIPNTQVKLVAGDVLDPTEQSEVIGHAWVRYISDRFPYNSFYIDWCFYPDTDPISVREAYLDYSMPIRPENGVYKSFWFMADDINGYKVK